jgi:hypothetical protein
VELIQSESLRDEFDLADVPPWFRILVHNCIIERVLTTPEKENLAQKLGYRPLNRSEPNALVAASLYDFLEDDEDATKIEEAVWKECDLSRAWYLGVPRVDLGLIDENKELFARHYGTEVKFDKEAIAECPMVGSLQHVEEQYAFEPMIVYVEASHAELILRAYPAGRPVLSQDEQEFACDSNTPEPVPQELVQVVQAVEEAANEFMARRQLGDMSTSIASLVSDVWRPFYDQVSSWISEERFHEMVLRQCSMRLRAQMATLSQAVVGFCEMLEE